MTPVLPSDHPLRDAVEAALHRDAPEPLSAPARVSCLVLLTGPAEREHAQRALETLAARYGVLPPGKGAARWRLELEAGRLLWEWQDGFVRCLVFAAGNGPPGALCALPAEWVAGLPGETLLALDLELQDARPGDTVARAALLFPAHRCAGAAIGDGAAAAFTDFRRGPEGASRMLVLDRHLTPALAGRLVTALLDLETFRALAMLAAALAEPLVPALDRAEAELRTVGAALPGAPALELSTRLRRLLLELDAAAAGAAPALAASASYLALARRRLAELHETRLPGLPTLSDRLERPLAAAEDSCGELARRHRDLAARAGGLARLLDRPRTVLPKRAPWIAMGALLGLLATAGAIVAGVRLGPALLPALAMPVIAGLLPRLRRWVQAISAPP